MGSQLDATRSVVVARDVVWDYLERESFKLGKVLNRDKISVSLQDFHTLHGDWQAEFLIVTGGAPANVSVSFSTHHSKIWLNISQIMDRVQYPIDRVTGFVPGQTQERR